MLGCEYCAREPEPGYIETDNNGPIVPCPFCNPETDYDRAERQRDSAPDGMKAFLNHITRGV